MIKKQRNLLFASNNPNKLAEAAQLFADVEIDIFTPEKAGIVAPDVDETGVTFAENALLKAQSLVPFTEYLIVADDSGLQVDVLDGLPGVHSKRWVAGSDEDRNKYLLEKLESTENRAAQFITVLCLLDPLTGETEYFEGIIRGTISTEIQGTQGFGYDPIFIPEGYVQTFAELGSEVKNTLSHRARAFAKLKDYILNLGK